MKRMIGFAIAVGILAALVPACARKASTSSVATGPQRVQPYSADQLAIGKTAPDIVGEDVDGKSMKLSDYRGKVVVLDFWGNW